METISPGPERPGPRVAFVGNYEEGMRSNPKFVLTRKLTELSATIMVIVSGRRFTNSSVTAGPVTGPQGGTEKPRKNVLRETIEKWLHTEDKQHRESDGYRIPATQQHTDASMGNQTAQQKPSLVRQIKGVFRKHRPIETLSQISCQPSPSTPAESLKIVEEVTTSTTVPYQTTTQTAPSLPLSLPISDSQGFPFHNIEDSNGPSKPVNTGDLNNSAPVNNSLSQGFTGEGNTTATCNGSDTVYHTTGYPNPSDNPSSWASSSTVRPQRFGLYGGDSSGDTDDDRSDEHEQRGKLPRGSPNRRKLACVYHKLDPQTYNVHHDQAFRVCAGTGFDFASGVVRHLLRAHREHTCKKCYQLYRTKEDCDTHTDRCGGKLPRAREERWAILWRTRFPADPLPDNPWQDVESPTWLTMDTGTRSGRASLPISSDPSHLLPASQAASVGSSTVVPQANLFTTHADQPETQTFSLTTILDYMGQRLDLLENRLSGFEQRLASLHTLPERSFNITHNAPGVTLNDIETAAYGSGAGGRIYTYDPSMLSVAYDQSALSPSGLTTPTTTPSSRSVSDFSMLSMNNQPPTAATSQDFGEQIYGTRGNGESDPIDSYLVDPALNSFDYEQDPESDSIPQLRFTNC